MKKNIDTGINDKFGKPIASGNKLKLVYETIELVGVAKQNKDGEWEIYKDEGNHLDLKRLQNNIEILNTLK